MGVIDGQQSVITNSIHKQFLDALADVVRGLQLDGLFQGGADVVGGDPLPAVQVYVRKLPTDRIGSGVVLPAVVVSLVPAPEGFLTVMNAADDYGYPCLVTIITVNNQDLTVDDAELYWRQLIRNAFHNKKPASVIAAVSVPVKRLLVVPYPILDLNLFLQQNLFVSSLRVDCWTREVRPAA